MSRFTVVVLVAVFAVSASAGPAGGVVSAPGRVVLDAGDGVGVWSDIRAFVALPDGGSLIAAAARNGFTVTRLRPDGALEPGFGSGGVARIALAGRLNPAQLLVQPTGAIVVVGSRETRGSCFDWPVALARLTAAGTLDRSFGDHGFITAAINGSCGPRTSAAADGSIVITGSVGASEKRLQPAVAKLTRDGAPDARFGGGLLKLPARADHDADVATSVEVTPEGRIVVAYSGHVVALTPDATVAADFNAAQAVSVPGASQALMEPGGAIDVLTIGATSPRIVRLTARGDRDATFGSAGAVKLAPIEQLFAQQMFPAADGAIALVSTLPIREPPRGAHAAQLAVQRVSADGRVLPKAILSPMFGGGATVFAIPFPLVQNALIPLFVAQRPDGSYLVAGPVGVLTLTEGGANGTTLPAIAAFTTSFSADRSFGGPRRAPTMTVRATNQPATRGPGPSFITLRVTASAPGIVRLTIRNTSGQLLGLQVAPIFAAGNSRVQIALTTRGRRLLRWPYPIVRITHQFRDIVAQSVSATRNVRLR